LLGAAFAAYKIYDMANGYRISETAYGELQQQAVLYTNSGKYDEASDAEEGSQSADGAGTEEYLKYPMINFGPLKEQNADCVGWVYIDGTNINYPVVQGEDNRHYISTMFNGKENKAGSIFMDFRNNSDMSDVHTILYGHNMKNKSMFADILNYQTQEYYDEHPVGVYITPDGVYRFEIVAGYVASLADPAWQLEFAGDEDVLAWINDAVEKTEFLSRVKPQAGDKYITLSTCSYEFNDARFVLVGVLK